MSTTSSTTSNKPLQFTDIDCSQLTLTDFKPNKLRESNQNAYINWSSSSQQRNVQLPPVVAVAGVKRFEGKIDKATGRQEKATISLLYPLSKTRAGDKLVFDKADAMWTRVSDLLVEKEGLSKQEAEFKLNKLISYPLDPKQKPMLDKDPSLKLKIPFDELTNQWYMNITRLQGREIKTPSVVFQQKIRSAESSKVILRDRPDITPLNICDEIPKMSTVYCLVAMNQLTLINGRYTWPIKVTKVVFELPQCDDLEMDLGDDVVHEKELHGGGGDDVVTPAPDLVAAPATVKPSLLQQLAAMNQTSHVVEPTAATVTSGDDAGDVGDDMGDDMGDVEYHE